MDQRWVTARLDTVLRYFADGYTFADAERPPEGNALRQPEIFVDTAKETVIFRFYVEPKAAKEPA